MDFSCVNNSSSKIKCSSNERKARLGAFFFIFPVPSCSVVISMWVNILIIARHLIPLLLLSPVINMWASLLLIWVFLRESMHVPVYPPLMSFTFHRNENLDATELRFIRTERQSAMVLFWEPSALPRGNVGSLKQEKQTSLANMSLLSISVRRDIFESLQKKK